MKALPGIFLFFIMSIFTMPLMGQYHTDSKKAVKRFTEALDHYHNRDNTAALEALGKAVKADDNFIEAWMLMAQINKENGHFDKAISQFEKALLIDPDYYPEGYVVLAKVEYNIGKYDLALANTDRFIELGTFSKVSLNEARSFRKLCSFAIRAVENPVPFHPENLGDSVNSDKNEYWPSLSVDESTLVFTVLYPKDPAKPIGFGNMQEDFYYSSRRPEGGWSKRHNLGKPLNTPDNEGAQSLSPDGRYLYFTACNRPDGQGMCDLYLSENIDGKWSSPVNLGEPVNTSYSEKHPSISADGHTLFFASDRPGGKGGLDIWYTVKSSDGTWLAPVNAGENINTPGNEQSPFIHPDGKTMYFSSEGHLNLGKGDIFIARLDDNGSWGPAKNLGYPINTFHNEIGMIVNSEGNRAYFSSDRLMGKGMDIYAFDLYPGARPAMVSYMKGRVYDAETFKGLAARFQLIDLATGKVTIESHSNPGEGEFLVPLPTNHNFALNVSHPGYMFYSGHFSFEGVYEKTDPYLKDVPLKPLKSGEKIVLKNIFFEFDSASLLPESRVELAKVVDFLNANPGIRVEISGHTDSIGHEAYNQELSQRRAKSVVDFLERKGIDPDRLAYKGYGASEPVAPNDTEEGRAQNRRTELKITGL
ncbi:MAG TPA: OmpA family protein [Bacteroidales bacterium]|nr:OmpA family protein [Bacteroidales bacterium]